MTELTTDRAWIIGNAPSLNNLDMKKLKNEVTFSFNRAYLAYEEWGWYPTYYCVIDAKVLRQITDDVNMLIESGRIKEFYLNAAGAEGIRVKDNVHLIEFSRDLNVKWGFDPVEFRYCGDVAAFALQVAYLKGYKNVYLAGVDMSWGQHGKTAPNADTDHFRTDYETESVRMSEIYASGHFKSWQKSIQMATTKPYFMKLTVTNPESQLRRFLPYEPFDEVFE